MMRSALGPAVALAVSALTLPAQAQEPIKIGVLQPMTGPATLPTAQVMAMIPTYLPRSLSGARSVMMTLESAWMPPPPMPWMVRPTRRTAKLWETAAMMAPAVKRVRAMRRIGLSPNTSEKEAKLGWKTVDARRKEVPLQKASTPDPWSSSAIVCRKPRLESYDDEWPKNAYW